jgi:hypothetical protein
MNATYCVSCGTLLAKEAFACSGCGSPTNQIPTVSSRPARAKSTAILLAVLVGPWAWIYTYAWNKRKFWIATSINATSYLASFIGVYFIYGWFVQAFDYGDDYQFSTFLTQLPILAITGYDPIPPRLVDVIVLLPAISGIVFWVISVIGNSRLKQDQLDKYPERHHDGN